MNTHDFTFREFVVNARSYSNTEIYAMYNDPYSPKTVREISLLSGKSIGELYRIIHQHGSPNRYGKNYHLISNYANMGMSAPQIAELTGYTERGIKNILNRNNNIWQ